VKAAVLVGCCFVLSSLFESGSATGAPITALVFSPDDSALVSTGGRTIEVRSPIDGSVKRRIECELQKITSIVFHPGGQLLAVAGGTPAVRGEVSIFDWREQKMICRLTNHTDLATCVAFNVEGTLIGVASADHSARVWRLSNARQVVTEAFQLIGHAGPVLAIAFSPTGRSVVTAGADRSVKVWSTEDGRLLRTFSQHTEAVHTLAFRPQIGISSEEPLATCASAGDDRTIRIWQPEIGRMVRIIRQHEGPIFTLAYSPDGASLYSAGKDGIVRRFESDGDTVTREWPASTDWIYAIAIDSEGSKLATGDWSGVVRLWDLKSSSPKKQE
jgi:WD40 repeat protein